MVDTGESGREGLGDYCRRRPNLGSRVGTRGAQRRIRRAATGGGDSEPFDPIGAGAGATSLAELESFPAERSVSEETEAAQAISRIHAHCAVFTRAEVARAVLDFLDWRSDRDLAGLRLLEPACGEGAFLLPAIERLVLSAKAFGRPLEGLGEQILAYEFDAATAEIARNKIVALLGRHAVEPELADRLATRWLRLGDFLVADVDATFSHVVGNPPYMRWSKLPKVLRRRYEQALPAHSARGDLCLSFVWRAVAHLRPVDGRVAFLCADRWLRCAYGGRAREALSKHIRVASHFEVHRVPVFDGDRNVGAYAGITVLDQAIGEGGEVQAFEDMASLTKRLSSGPPSTDACASVLVGGDGAILASGPLRTLFEAMSTGTVRLAEAAIEVRCGMALGVAEAFVVDENTPIEASRLVPFVRACDIGVDGAVVASRRVLDVWTPEGRLIELEQFPRLQEHLARHRKALEARACVAKPEQWHRTIDRMRRERLAKPRIVVAGMAKHSRVGWLPAGLQPSNALYTLSSDQWPLRPLYALLRIGVLDVFATVLAPRFSGGSLRFDGNVLGQVRIPLWSSLDEALRTRLATMADDEAMPIDLVAALYGLDDETSATMAALSSTRSGVADS